MATEPEPSSEPSRAEKALAVFLSLGDQRTYRAVAAQLGVALPTVKRWAKAGRWQSRVREQEAKVARELHDRYSSGLLAQNERNLKIVRAALLSLAKDISERKIRGQYSDIPRLLQLEQELLKEPRTDDDIPLSHRSAVVIYLPDDGSSHPDEKIWTKEELRRDGHDVDGLF
jgi:transposase-like protein